MHKIGSLPFQSPVQGCAVVGGFYYLIRIQTPFGTAYWENDGFSTKIVGDFYRIETENVKPTFFTVSKNLDVVEKLMDELLTDYFQ